MLDRDQNGKPTPLSPILWDIDTDPVLAGTQVDRSVRLSAGPCDDWRSSLKASFADAARVRFAGSCCGLSAFSVSLICVYEFIYFPDIWKIFETYMNSYIFVRYLQKI